MASSACIDFVAAVVSDTVAGLVPLKGWFLDVLHVHRRREGHTLCYACRGTLVHKHGAHANALRVEGLLCERGTFLRIRDGYSDGSLRVFQGWLSRRSRRVEAVLVFREGCFATEATIRNAAM